MSNIPAAQIINNTQNGTPTYSYANSYTTPNNQTVTVAPPQNSSGIYQYPQTSIYNDPNKQAASGVNIYIYNPSAIGAPNSMSTANATYTMPNPNIQNQPLQQAQQQTPPAAQNISSQTTIANTPINNTEEQNSTKKTKQVVDLTDDYIKSLESYIKNQDANIRKTGIIELIKRFEEDSSRYNDPALTALLNVALQDPAANNRVLAMSVIAGGNATGDENTKALLDNLQKSDKLFGQEALMANKALLQTSQTRITVPDNSPDKPTQQQES